MPWAIPAAIGGISSIIGSALGANTTKTLPGPLQGAQSQLLGYYGGILNNPTQGMQPMLESGLDQINRGYSQLPDLITRQLAARGFGKSGKLGTASYNIGAQRLGDISQFQSMFNQMALQRQAGAAQGEEGLVNAGYGINQGGIGAGLMTAGNAFSNLADAIASQPQQPQQQQPFLYYNGANSFTTPGWNSISNSMIGGSPYGGGGYIPQAPAAPGYSPTPYPSILGNGMPSSPPSP